MHLKVEQLQYYFKPGNTLLVLLGWHNVIPCLVLSCLALSWLKINHSHTCLWLLATLVVVGFNNVLEKYYLYAQCEIDNHIHEKKSYVENCKNQSKMRQDQARQDNMRWHPDKKVPSGFDLTLTHCLLVTPINIITQCWSTLLLLKLWHNRTKPSVVTGPKQTNKQMYKWSLIKHGYFSDEQIKIKNGLLRNE